MHCLRSGYRHFDYAAIFPLLNRVIGCCSCTGLSFWYTVMFTSGLHVNYGNRLIDKKLLSIKVFDWLVFLVSTEVKHVLFLSIMIGSDSGICVSVS